MTENKRFTWEYSHHDSTGEIIDWIRNECLMTDYLQKYELEEWCQELNKIVDENNQLRKENGQLKQDRDEMFIRERDTKNEWRKLKEENEQLREELGSFEQVDFTDMCDGSRTVLYMKKENVGDVE